MTRLSDTEVEEYHQSVLRYLGGDDPLEVQSGDADAWRGVVEEAGDDLRTRPADGEWSVLELLGHITDSELVNAARYRWVLAEDAPPLVGYDQDAWVARLDHAHDDSRVLLALFSVLRASNLALWRRTSPADRARVGAHAERGDESLDLLFRMQAGHGRLHRAQADRTLAAVRGRGPA
jgi:hypothetical protein